MDIVSEFYQAKAACDAGKPEAVERFMKACDAAKAKGYLVVDGRHLSATGAVQNELKASPDFMSGKPIAAKAKKAASE